MRSLCLLAADKIGQSLHAGKMLAQVFFFAVHLEAESFLHRQPQFECIDRIQPQALIAKQRRIGVDIGFSDVFQPQAVDD